MNEWMSATRFTNVNDFGDIIIIVVVVVVDPLKHRPFTAEIA